MDGQDAQTATNRRAQTVDGDRYPQTVGFVVAGVGLAATLLEWTPVSAPVTWLTSGWAALALVAFALGRYGVGPAWLDYVAGVGAAGLALTASAAIVGLRGALPYGPPVALLAGIVGIGVAVAAANGQGREALLGREQRSVTAVAVSAVALVFGSLLASVVLGVVPDDPVVAIPVQTAVSSVGYALAGFAFVRSFDGGVDASVPDRRDVVVAAVGVVAIFALHVAMVGVVQAFSLPKTTHGLVETARTHPGILPPLVVLSFLAIAPAEELLARNGVQKYLYGAFSRYGAVVVGCLVFTGVHLLAYAGGATPGAVLVTLARLFVVSLVLGVVYERTDDLFAPVVVHGAYDGVQFALAYLAFS
ncbi:CPBP family intramembrane glutamic endopeptidase [Halobacterium zhouii]|uniref:CPBP family intramembrane glutamic endopeptidase n=1 Tax=Halobacterium zhouii TaxID=2902624 RepID=UPI001E62B9AE|nr:CPBP family intramembrane glutamic endopeptidase [Halobacterium zhouii]